MAHHAVILPISNANDYNRSIVREKEWFQEIKKDQCHINPDLLVGRWSIFFLIRVINFFAISLKSERERKICWVKRN